MNSQQLKPSKKSQVLAIVVTFNGADWISSCLGSIYNSTFKPDVVVVDNCSSDNTIEIIKKDFSHVKVIENKENIGFGRANNQGLTIAIKENYEFVLLLNQDALLEFNTLECLIDQAKNDVFWIISPIQKNQRNDMIEFQFLKYLKKNFVNIKINKIQEVDFVNAAIWFVNINCIKVVGGFDPLFPHYGEDNDYIRRIQFWGGKIGVYPGAIGYHERYPSTTFNKHKQTNRTSLVFIGLLKNINHSFLINVLITFTLLIRKISKNIMDGHFQYVTLYLHSYWIALMHLKMILNHRSLSKRKGAFLNL